MRKIETDPARLRKLSARARRMAEGAAREEMRQRLFSVAAEYEQRANEVEIDDITGQ